MPGSTEEFQNNGIAAELGEMLAYLLAAAAVVVITRITIRIVQTNRQLHEKRVLAAERAAEDAEHETANQGQMHTAPDQTFALPGAAPGPSGRGGRPGFVAAARQSMRMSKGRMRGSAESRAGSGGGERPVTGFGRGLAASNGPGSTPPPGYPQRSGSVGYAPPQ